MSSTGVIFGFKRYFFPFACCLSWTAFIAVALSNLAVRCVVPWTPTEDELKLIPVLSQVVNHWNAVALFLPLVIFIGSVWIRIRLTRVSDRLILWSFAVAYIVIAGTVFVNLFAILLYYLSAHGRL